MRRKPITWRGMIYYGEVVGFVLAWVAGIAALTGDWGRPVSDAAIDRLAAVEPPADWRPGER